MEVVMNALLGEPKNLHSLDIWSVVQVNGGVRSRGDEDGSSSKQNELALQTNHHYDKTEY